MTFQVMTIDTDGQLTFAPVQLFIHRDPNAVDVRSVVLTLVPGTIDNEFNYTNELSLTLTPQHLLPVVGCETSRCTNINAGQLGRLLVVGIFLR